MTGPVSSQTVGPDHGPRSQLGTQSDVPAGGQVRRHRPGDSRGQEARLADGPTSRCWRPRVSRWSSSARKSVMRTSLSDFDWSCSVMITPGSWQRSRLLSPRVRSASRSSAPTCARPRWREECSSRAQAVLNAPPATSTDDLRSMLEGLAQELMVEIRLSDRLSGLDPELDIPCESGENGVGWFDGHQPDARSPPCAPELADHARCSPYWLPWAVSPSPSPLALRFQPRKGPSTAPVLR